MPTFGISFAGHHIRIKHESDQAETFLHFLFSDLPGDTAESPEAELFIERVADTDAFRISIRREQLFEGRLGVKAAAILFDTVIFHLLNHNSSGVALHSGAVSQRGQCILLPGVSGAGKSSVAAHLAANGFSYATDELVFFHSPGTLDFLPFTRPICLKGATVPAVPEKNTAPPDGWLEDEYGAIIPHRFLHPDFTEQRQTAELILFPFYEKNAVTRIDKVSAAQASARLMGCCANGRNLKGHGFREIVFLARSKPAYQLTYSSFSGLEMMVKQLLRASGACRA